MYVNRLMEQILSLFLKTPWLIYVLHMHVNHIVIGERAGLRGEDYATEWSLTVKTIPKDENPLT